MKHTMIETLWASAARVEHTHGKYSPLARLVVEGAVAAYEDLLDYEASK